jgi:hypothetical protein
MTDPLAIIVICIGALALIGGALAVRPPGAPSVRLHARPPHTEILEQCREELIAWGQKSLHSTHGGVQRRRQTRK